MASGYDAYEVEEPRQHKHRHHKDREPRYVETKETYVRGSAPLAATLSPDAAYTTRNKEIIRQPLRNDSDLSIEEVRRDFPPPSGASYAAQRTLVREDRYGPPARGRDRDGEYYDSRRRSYNDLSRKGRGDKVVEEPVERPRSLTRNQKIIAAVGGAALAVGGKEIWDRRQAAGNFDGEARPRNAMATAAVGAAGAFAGYEGAEIYAKKVMKKEKVKNYTAIEGKNGKVNEYISSDDEAPRSRKKDRRGSSSSDDKKKKKKDKKDKDKEPDKQAKIQQSAKAALLAGAYEAFRVRNEPGTWNGEKGKRILTAAIGAGGIDAAADRNPSDNSKRHILEAVVGGLAGNRLINGSRKEVVADEVTGRSTSRARSRSRAASRVRGEDGGDSNGGGLGALAAAGIAGLAGSKLLSRSRSRARKDSDSDSDDSRGGRRNGGSQKRSKSVTDYARKGLAALGLGEAASKASDRDRDRDDDSGYRGSSRRAPSRGPYGDERYADSRSSVGGRSRNEGRNSRRAAEESEDDTSSLGSSSGDERRIKKMKGKQFLTAGLASVATIHAAHNIYQSMEKRDARHKAVAEGEMTPEEARKLKAKATLQDAASVGIAALGIKGAISEIKEANEMRHECAEFNEKKGERHQRRLARIQGRKAAGDGGGNNHSQRRIDGPRYDDSPRYDDDYGPHYHDGNPYAAGLPAPPVDYPYDYPYDRR